MTVDEGLVDVDTCDGVVRGRVRAGIRTFLGVPYAAPPVGPRRFMAPQPVSSWSGVREALEPGASAPQRGSATFAGLDMVPVTGAEWRRGDDFLTLNIWAPAAGLGHPVMVYVHGGGLVLGTKDAAVYDGGNFARDGVVAVGINYRLGVEGFLPIPGAPSNLGLRDMAAALTWVRTNIAAFGGDPDNITMFGESGGGMAVACLVVSPLTPGLFRRAIVQSGHGSAVYPLDVALRTTYRIAEQLRVQPDLNGFRSVDPERCVAALNKVSRPGSVDLRNADGFDPSFGLGVINPVVGDDALPTHPLIALEAGAGGATDLLIGTTAEEARFWFGPTRLTALPHPLARRLLTRVTPNARALFDTYAHTSPGDPGGTVLSRVLTDMAFRWPARQFAQNHSGRTHVYEFDWRSPAAHGRLGAAHGLDLPFVFDTLNTVTGRRGIAGHRPPQHLADHMHQLWVQYATDGTLPWPEFNIQNRHVYHLASRQVLDEPPLPAAHFTPSTG